MRVCEENAKAALVALDRKVLSGRLLVEFCF